MYCVLMNFKILEALYKTKSSCKYLLWFAYCFRSFVMLLEFGKVRVLPEVFSVKDVMTIFKYQLSPDLSPTSGVSW